MNENKHTGDRQERVVQNREYQSTPRSVSDGEYASGQCDVNGNAKVTQATRADEVNDGMRAYDDDYNYKVIKTATTTTVLAEAGFIKEIRVVGGTLGDVTVYDNTAGSGAEIVPTVTPDKGQVLKKSCLFATGLTIVTAAATFIVVSYRT